jgi:hypothetical protein
MLRVRTEVVKEVVATHFGTHETELEKRRLESTVLQILAAIYAPPRSVTPIDVDKLLICVKEAKENIDVKEAERKIVSMNIKESEPHHPYPVFCHSPLRQECRSPIPGRCLVRNDTNDIIMERSMPLLRPTPRRAPTPLNPDMK